MTTKLMLWSVSVAVIALGCMKAHNGGELSASQVAAVAELNGDYQSAKVYNDSLISAVGSSNSTAIHYFDNKYHHYASRFDSCHRRYEHNLVSANHSHNSMGTVEMHGPGNAMMDECQCCSNGGHRADIHQQMDELSHLHSHYHP